MFRKLVRESRCCVVAIDGFYEWARCPRAGRRTTSCARAAPIFVAGLWDCCHGGKEDRRASDVHDPNDAPKRTHQRPAHRMPVIVRPEYYAPEWTPRCAILELAAFAEELAAVARRETVHRWAETVPAVRSEPANPFAALRRLPAARTVPR